MGRLTGVLLVSKNNPPDFDAMIEVMGWLERTFRDSRAACGALKSIPSRNRRFRKKKLMRQNDRLLIIN